MLVNQTKSEYKLNPATDAFASAHTFVDEATVASNAKQDKGFVNRVKRAWPEIAKVDWFSEQQISFCVICARPKGRCHVGEFE